MTCRAWCSILLLTLAAASASGQPRPGLTWRQLDAPAVFSGVACGPTGRAKAAFFASGRLESCPLERDTMIAGHRLPAETWIYLEEDGTLRRAWLRRDTDIQGHLCKGTGYKGWITEFHDTGALMLCYLAGEQVVDGIACRGGSFWGELTGGVKVWFHANGRLRSCRVARDVKRTDMSLRGGQRIELDSLGAPAPRGTPPSPP